MNTADKYPELGLSPSRLGGLAFKEARILSAADVVRTMSSSGPSMDAHGIDTMSIPFKR